MQEMDIKRAIEILKAGHPFAEDEDEEFNEALKLAINSLEIDAKYNLIHEDAKAAEQWISVADRYPEDGENDVLVCDYDGDIYKGYLSEYGGWRRSDDFEKIKSVVAWMPLPEPYKGE